MHDYEKTGALKESDLALPSKDQYNKGVAIIECIQNIPCNPCVDACPFGAITMKDINSPPEIDYNTCTGCTKCIGVCPGLAIFVVKTEEEWATITLPYEFFPLPQKGDTVIALDRYGKEAGEVPVIKSRKQGKTGIVTIKVSNEQKNSIRNIRVIT